MREIENILPFGGLNLDDDNRLMPNTDSDYRMNIIYDQDGRGGVLSPMLGNSLKGVMTSTATTLGWCRDDENDKLYLFFMVSSGETLKALRISEYVETSGLFEGERGVEVITINGLLDVATTYVSSGVLRGKLYWTTGGGEICSLNVSRAKNYTLYKNSKEYTAGLSVVSGERVYIRGMGLYLSSNTGIMDDISYWIDNYLTFITAELYWDVDNDFSQIFFIKKPPTATVSVDKKYDLSPGLTPIVERVLSFSYRYVYKDNERSVFAKPSVLVFNPYGMGNNEDANSFYAVDVEISRGNEDVKKVEVVVQNSITGNWFKVGEVLSSEFLSSDTYNFTFHNGLVEEPIDNAEVDKPYDAIPRLANALTIAENVINVGGITEDYDVTTPPYLSVSVIPISTTNILTAFASEAQSWGVTGMKRFSYRSFSMNSAYLSSVPEGVGVKLRLTWQEAYLGSLVWRVLEHDVVSDGTVSGEEFLQQLCDYINTIHNNTDIYHPSRAYVVNLYATVYNYGGLLMISVMNGVYYLFNYIDGYEPEDITPVGEQGAFMGTDIYEGVYTVGEDDLYDLINTVNASHGKIFQIPNIFFQTIDPYSEQQTIFMGECTNEVGVVYYDEYMRKSPVVSKTSLTMLRGQALNGRYNVQVVIDGEAPSWAKHYSLARTAGGMQDGEMIHSLGMGTASELSMTGDDDDYPLIKSLTLTGVKAEDTDEGKLYWAYERNSGILHLYDSYGSGKKLVAISGYIDFFDQVAVTEPGLWEASIFPKGGTSISGQVIFTEHLRHQDFAISSDRYIEVSMSTTEEDDGYYIYRINIAPYVNAVRKNLKQDHSVYMPSRGHKMSVKNGLVYDTLTVEKIEPGRVVGEKEGVVGYFLNYWVQPYRTQKVIDFTDAEILFYVEGDAENVFFEESIVYPVEYEEGLYKHKGGNNYGEAGVVLYISSGDAYLRERAYLSSNGSVMVSKQVESFRISDDYNSKVWAKGRVNTYNRTFHQKELPTAIRHGGALLPETELNNICSFDGNDIKLLSFEFGDIIRMEAMSNSIRILHTKRRVTIDIGRDVITRPDGTEDIVAQGGYYGSVRPSAKRWGVTHYNSVVNAGGELYYYDSNSKQMVVDGQQGQSTISGRVSQGEYSHDFKMSSYFQKIVGGIIPGWDEYNQMLFVTANVAGTTKTVGFHRPSGRWISYYSFTPVMYLNMNSDFYSLHSRRIYKHNSLMVPRCNFYSMQSTSHVKVIANKNPLNMKLFDALTIRLQGLTNITNDFIKLYIEGNDTYSRGMYSVITSGMLRLEEGEYRADILKNMLTTSEEISVMDLHNGDDMRGYFMEILMDFEDSDYKLLGVSVLETISK